ncbi:hypothetical protein Tco_0675043 [Tanacetum coccineum]
MAALKFASSHNMVAFLDKPTKSDGFEQIVDFLNAHSFKYALTVNPTIHTSCIVQFWTTTKVKTVNEEVQIQALVDNKKVIVPDTSVRSDLQLEDAEVIALETTKTNQALEIDSLKRRVKKLEKKKGSRTHRLRRLFKVGRSAQVVSSEDEGLGAQEDASKQGRKIAGLDADAEEVEVEKVVSTAKVTTASATTTTVDELTLAQTLIEIKAAKPKAAKDKGKEKMVEPEKPLKKKDQILIDEEIAQRLQEELQAELEEEERLARQKEEDANIAE